MGANDGIPKRTSIKIFDINGEDCSLLKKNQKIEKRDLKILQNFNLVRFLRPEYQRNIVNFVKVYEQNL